MEQLPPGFIVGIGYCRLFSGARSARVRSTRRSHGHLWPLTRSTAKNKILLLTTIDKTHSNAGTVRLVLQADNFSQLNHPHHPFNPCTGSAQASERGVLGERLSVGRNSPDTHAGICHKNKVDGLKSYLRAERTPIPVDS